MKWSDVNNPKNPEVYRGKCIECNNTAWVQTIYNLYDDCKGAKTEEQEFEFIFLCSSCRHFIRLDAQGFELYGLEIFSDGTVTMSAGGLDEILSVGCDAYLVSEYLEEVDEPDIINIMLMPQLSGNEFESTTIQEHPPNNPNNVRNKITLEEETF